jgi:hypothetical protein
MTIEALVASYMIYYVIAVAFASFIIGFRVAKKQMLGRAIFWGVAGSVLSYALLALLGIPAAYLGIATVLLGVYIEPLRHLTWLAAVISLGSLFFATLIFTHVIIRKLFNKNQSITQV